MGCESSVVKQDYYCIAYLMEVVIFFRGYHTAHEGKTFQVLSFSETHGEDIHLTDLDQVSHQNKIRDGRTKPCQLLPAISASRSLHTSRLPGIQPLS